MDQSAQKTECARKWWKMSAIGGAVLAAILWLFAGWGFFSALVIGIIVAVAAGVVLSRINCDDSTVPGSAPAAQPAQDTPAPAPAPKAQAAAPAAAASVAPPAKSPPAKKAAPKATAKPAAKKAAAAKPVAADGKPEMLTAARAGGADNLKLLKGVGPKLEQTLNELGVFHFDQIASWRKKEIQWVDERLKFKGRIERDDWIKQAKVLAKGGETEFSKRNKKS